MVFSAALQKEQEGRVTREKRKREEACDLKFVQFVSEVLKINGKVTEKITSPWQ